MPPTSTITQPKISTKIPWLMAHGRLWYDDRWYRTAWLVWPQAAGLLIFVVFWLNPPNSQHGIPWA